MQYDRAPKANKSLPPGPTLSPRAQALRWIGRPYDFLRECAARFGDMFTLDMGLDDGKYVVVSHPEAVRRIVTADVGTLRVCNAVLSPLLGPGSLLLLNGEAHLGKRRVLVPAFQHKAIGGYGHLIREVLSDMTADWGAGVEFVAQDVLQHVALNIIFRIIFGNSEDALSFSFKKALVAILNDRRLDLGLMAGRGDSGTIPALGSFWRKFEDVRARALELVSARSIGGDPGTLLSMLAQATDKYGEHYSSEDLRDEVLTLLVTGHETTATALSWGLFWTTRIDAVRERIRAEMDGRPRGVEPTEYANLPYLDATCKEILRIYPIVPSLFRQVVGEPFAIANRTFEPGTFLSPSIYLVHHRQDVYPDLDKFEPGRFLGTSFSPYEYLPFGGGSRRCIGMHLAMFEMKIVLGTLLQRFDFELVAQQPIVPARRLVTVAPGERLRLRVRTVRSTSAN